MASNHPANAIKPYNQRRFTRQGMAGPSVSGDCLQPLHGHYIMAPENSVFSERTPVNDLSSRFASSASLTAELVDLIRAKPVTESDLEMAALFTLDAVANSLAGRNSAPGRILLSWAGSYT